MIMENLGILHDVNGALVGDTLQSDFLNDMWDDNEDQDASEAKKMRMRTHREVSMKNGDVNSCIS
jgi:hypothetical protein